MRFNKGGFHEPTSITEAALLSYAIVPVCRCGHRCSFDPWGLWYHFERRRWDGEFSAAKVRFWCRVCASRQKAPGRKDRVRPIRFDLEHPPKVDVRLPRPPEHEWKRVVNRTRC
ncbi:hypothetical protein [Novosphingobium lindaniclasticum]|uniref:hypothetical protein n=1 Tax=Novosphingobium lindaniclasticum TaxID=1329895 RepID=UPI0012681000|nr:hypothetical protein [Novosphingobium lindaniclasticum]